MARRANTKEDYRTLFARTGNQCAFPGCSHPLIDDDNDFIAQVCHIEAANEGGKRYNPTMTDEERKSVDNLMVLCYPHHIKTNNEELYSATRLRKMKAEHESKYAASTYQISEQVLSKIFEEQLQFELTVSQVNTEWRQICELAMDLQLSDPSYHFNEIFVHLSRISHLLDEIREFLDSLPDHNSFWEMINIGMPNFLNFIHFHLKALEVLIEFEKQKNQPNNTSIQKKVEGLKSQLLSLSSTLVHVD